MGGSETVHPAELRALAGQLDSQLTPIFEKALQAFEAAEIGGPAFSLYGAELAVTYPGTQHFALRDVQTKAEAVQSIIDRLNSTATAWERADSHSTVKEN